MQDGILKRSVVYIEYSIHIESYYTYSVAYTYV
jgi:hypothetical protein